MITWSDEYRRYCNYFQQKEANYVLNEAINRTATGAGDNMILPWKKTSQWQKVSTQVTPLH